jgi:hypothetical protein
MFVASPFIHSIRSIGIRPRWRMHELATKNIFSDFEQRANGTDGEYGYPYV